MIFFALCSHAGTLRLLLRSAARDHILYAVVKRIKIIIGQRLTTREASSAKRVLSFRVRATVLRLLPTAWSDYKLSLGVRQYKTNS